MLIVSSGKPNLPYFFTTTPDNIAPTERFLLLIAVWILTNSEELIAFVDCSINFLSITSSVGSACSTSFLLPNRAGNSG